MKSFLASFLLILVLCSFNSTSITEVVSSLKAGNAYKLSKYFDNTVDITLSDKSNSYSKSQAELVLRDFFYTNTVVNFEVVHSGDNAGSQYLIGNLQTKKGSYRTTIYIKQKADRQVLQEIRFER